MNEEFYHYRIEADAAFVAHDWEGATGHFRECMRITDQIWKQDFQPSADVLQVSRDVPEQLAYALAKAGKGEEAVLALENGLARYLRRLLITKDLSDLTDPNIIHYVNAARDLYYATAQAKHKSLEDSMPMAVQLTLAIQRKVKGRDAEILGELDTKLHALMKDPAAGAQLENVVTPLLRGEKPKPNFAVNKEIVRQFIEILLGQQKILRKYDFSDIADPNEQRKAQAEDDLREHAKDLPESWFQVTWDEIEQALGAKPGGKTARDEPLPIVYMIITDLGLLGVIVHPSQGILSGSVQCIFSSQVKRPQVLNLSALFSDGEIASTPALGQLLCGLWPLISPVVSALESKGYGAAVLIPTGPLSNLPLHAAMSSATGLAMANERVAFTYSPSARLLAQARKIAEDHRSSELDYIGIVNPVPTSLKQLPMASAEVNVVAARFVKRWGSFWWMPRVLSGDAAYRFSILKYPSDNMVRHFACHATYNATDPLLSGIYVANDELCSAADFMRRTERFRLTVLSCCSSGRAGTSHVDESLGLPGLLLAAGNIGIIATFWPVYDLAATLLVIRFYDFWLEEVMSPGRALAKAQSWMLQSTKADKLSYLQQKRSRELSREAPEDFLADLTSNFNELETAVQEPGSLSEETIIRTASAYFMTGL